jgi:hypothetical protein
MKSLIIFMKNVEKVHHDKALTRTHFRAIFTKAKEGKPAAAADQRLLCAQTFIAGIGAKVENDRRKSLSGLWGDDKTVSPILSKDLKLSKKLARWWRQLKATEMKKERV